MATGYVMLWPGEVTFPDGASGNAFPGIEQILSSAAAPTNGCKVHFLQLVFDAATDEHVIFSFPLPGDYASGGTLRVKWKRKSGTGAANAVWKAAVAALTAGGTEVPDSKAFSTVATTTTAAGTTANAVQETTITLTMDSAAAGDMLYLMLGRDGDNAADTLDAIDACVVGVTFEYTTA